MSLRRLRRRIDHITASAGSNSEPSKPDRPVPEPRGHQPRGHETRRPDPRSAEVAFEEVGDLLVVTERFPIHDGGGHGDPDSRDPREESRRLYFDLETSGLGSSATIFMAGYGFVEGSEMVVVQEIARDVARERALVESAVERIAGSTHLVVYNGRSFDVPLLVRRARFHGIEFREPDRDRVVDLLPLARRRFKSELTRFRLTDVGRHVGAIDRVRHRTDLGDLPSSEVPGRFEEFSRTGDAQVIAPVVVHNQLDIEVLHRIEGALRAVGENDEPS